MLTKVCTKCGEEKELTQFYKHKNTVDGVNSWCKDCQRKSQKSFKESQTNEEISTAYTRQILAQHGIPCSVGGRIPLLPWVDLLAWGCVPIEAKTSQEYRSNSFVWKFSKKQFMTSFFGFYVFVAIYTENDPRVFVVPSQVDWLVEEDRTLQRMGFSVTIESSHHKSSNWEFLAPFENRFELIDQARDQYSAYLSSQYHQIDIASLGMYWSQLQ